MTKRREEKKLEGYSERNDCDNEEAFEFLNFLRRKNQPIIQELAPTSKEDWSKVMKKSKKNSAFSFFSNRNNAM